MPRVENKGANVHEWAKRTGEGSSTHDVCAACYVELLGDPHMHDESLEPYNGDPRGEYGWAGDVDHPDYSDDDYRCAVCGHSLYELHDGSGYDVARVRRLLDVYFERDAA